MVPIPLYRRDGSLAAYTYVDLDDAVMVSRRAWHFNSHGYAAHSFNRGIKPSAIKLHRWLLRLSHGDGFEVDHINRDRLDNRRSNLRIISGSHQNQNQKTRSDSRSGYRGVQFRKDRKTWRAYYSSGGRRVFIGTFATAIEAHQAIQVARSKHLPFSTD